MILIYFNLINNIKFNLMNYFVIIFFNFKLNKVFIHFNRIAIII